MAGESLASRVAVIEEAAKSRDREIRDLKSGLRSANEKLDDALLLLAELKTLPLEVKVLTKERHEQNGAVRFGKWIIGAGFFGSVGSGAYGIWHFFAGR